MNFPDFPGGLLIRNPLSRTLKTSLLRRLRFARSIASILRVLQPHCPLAIRDRNRHNANCNKPVLGYQQTDSHVDRPVHLRPWHRCVEHIRLGPGRRGHRAKIPEQDLPRAVPSTPRSVSQSAPRTSRRPPPARGCGEHAASPVGRVAPNHRAERFHSRRLDVHRPESHSQRPGDRRAGRRRPRHRICNRSWRYEQGLPGHGPRRRLSFHGRRHQLDPDLRWGKHIRHRRAGAGPVEFDHPLCRHW